MLIRAPRCQQTFNAFSATWAYWNSPFNSHCGNASWNGTGLCGEAFTDLQWNVTRQLKALGVQPLPIVETCCLCVLNASYDFGPAMGRLIADAVENNFSGAAEKKGGGVKKWLWRCGP